MRYFYNDVQSLHYLCISCAYHHQTTQSPEPSGIPPLALQQLGLQPL